MRVFLLVLFMACSVLADQSVEYVFIKTTKAHFQANRTKFRAVGRRMYHRFSGSENTNITARLLVMNYVSTDFRFIANTNITAVVIKWPRVKLDGGSPVAWDGPNTEWTEAKAAQAQTYLGGPTTVAIIRDPDWAQVYLDHGIEHKPQVIEP